MQRRCVLGLLWVLWVLAGCRAPTPPSSLPEESVARTTVIATPLVFTLAPTQSRVPPASIPPTLVPTATLSPSPLPPSSTPTHTATPTPSPTPQPSLTPTLNVSAAQPGASQNLALVGHDALGAIGWHAGLALQAGCAYVGNSVHPAVGIVDIADPAHPSTLPPLALSPGARPIEVRTLPDLNLLVVVDLGLSQLLTFDVSDCAHPRPLGAIRLSATPHEFYLWRGRDAARGERVLAFAATFDDPPPSLFVIDLTDPTQPQEVGRWNAADEGVRGVLHSLSVSPDGSTANLALWGGGFLEARVSLPQISVVRDAQGGFAPLDFANTHSAVPMRDRRYVLLASELYNCPFGYLAIVDVADPGHPQIVSEFRLPENRCGDLPAGGLFAPHNPLVVGDLAFVSWYAAGVQVVDLRDPLNPRRVGQFVPTGEGAAPTGMLGAYPIEMISYLILRDGLFYVVDGHSGLYVLRYTGPGAETLAGIALAEGNVTVREQ